MEKGRKRFLLSTQRIVVGQRDDDGERESARRRREQEKEKILANTARVDFWHTGGCCLRNSHGIVRAGINLPAVYLRDFLNCKPLTIFASSFVSLASERTLWP